MKTPFLFLLCILFSCGLYAQYETKVSNFYPSPEEMKIKEKEQEHTGNVYASGCVDGNCKDGEGTYVHVFGERVIDVYLTGPSFNVQVYKGRFSNNGKNFDGSFYQRTIRYEAKRDGKTVKFTPQGSYNLQQDDLTEFEKGSGHMEGTAAVEKPVYMRWWNWMKQDLSKTETGVLTIEKYYRLKAEYARVTYAPGSYYKSFEGRLNGKGDFFSGKLQFADGGQYEGFLYRNKFFGPGKYTDASGKTSQGLWMLDSLTMPMEIALPEIMIKPVDEDAVPYDAAAVTKTFDAANGWKLKKSGNDIFFAAWSNGNFNGPGIRVSGELNYQVGSFADGVFYSGMRIKDASKYYSPGSTSLITGRFNKNGQAQKSCGKKIIFSANGAPQTLIEGRFYPSSNTDEEFADGWVYVNDWAGLREKKNLQYWYSGHHVLDNDFPANWLIDAAKEANENSYCFASMQEQSADMLARITQLGDSMLVVKKRQEAAAEAEREKLATANRKKTAELKACNDLLNKHKVSVGTTVTRGSFTGYISEVDCAKERIVIIVPRPAGVYSNQPEKQEVSFADFSLWSRSRQRYHVCDACSGKGGETITVTNSKTKELPFGYFSGIETKITKTWTEKLWSVCSRCKGSGLLLQ